MAASPTLTLVVLVDTDLAPSNLKARGSGEKVALTWDTPAKDAGSVTGYQILRGRGDGDLETLVADTQSTGTDYTDSDVSGKLTEYRYQVKALRSGEASQGSNVAEVLVALAARGDATGVPTITGTAHVGMALTADASTIDDPDGITGATFTYQWVRSDGTDDSDIDGATDSTYTLVASRREARPSRSRSASPTMPASNEEPPDQRGHRRGGGAYDRDLVRHPDREGKTGGCGMQGVITGDGTAMSGFPEV